MTQKLQKASATFSYLSNPYSLMNNGQQLQGFGDNIYPAGTTPLSQPYYIGGYANSYYRLEYPPVSYADELFQCRFFYRTDPTASTVINRMAELAGGKLRNMREYCDDEEFNYFNGISERLTTLLQQCALEYLVAGMAIPDYATVKVMGNRLHPELGRKRYSVPDRMWARNPDNIVLKRTPFGPDRLVFLRIPPDESAFINNKGKYSDGTEDIELYNLLIKEFPDYVAAIQQGKSQIQLKNVRPILRKPQPNCDYPQPFLVPALSSLKHKLRIKEMDHSLATKAIEAIMHIKVGSDEFPVTEDDDSLSVIQTQMRARDLNVNNQAFYKLYTAHTTAIEFIIPPLDALLSSSKYEAVDSDIFMAMGFSRMLLVGETAKSNAGAGPQIILGPLAMLEEMRTRLLDWTCDLYEELADANNFSNVPRPMFEPLSAVDGTTLVTNAGAALKAGVISKNTFAQFFGTDFETEQRQIEFEVQSVADSPNIDQQVQLNQQTHTAPPSAPQGNTNPDGTQTPPPEPQMPSDTLRG